MNAVYLTNAKLFVPQRFEFEQSRLLADLSKSIEVEKKMINRMKAECGHQYTSRLEGMFKDINVSRDIMRSYEQWLKNGEFCE